MLVAGRVPESRNNGTWLPVAPSRALSVGALDESLIYLDTDFPRNLRSKHSFTVLTARLSVLRNAMDEETFVATVLFVVVYLLH